MSASILMSTPVLLLAVGFAVIAPSAPAAESSTEFFIRVVGRIFQDNLQLNLSRLEDFPSNHLSSEACRLLKNL